MLDWFTTIPGILIICGILLLVIAIVLFIVGSKKDKKEAKKTVSVNDSNTTDGLNSNENSISVSPVEPAVDVISTPNVNVDNVPVSEGTVQVENKVDLPTFDTPTIDMPLPVAEPTVEETSSVQPSIEPVAQTKEETTSVYGGATPVYNFSVSEDKPVTIYGGNDPLEATQTLPKMEEHHLPYGGVDTEINLNNIDQNLNASAVSHENVDNSQDHGSNEVVTEIPAEEIVTPVINIPDQEEDVSVNNVPTESEVKTTVEEL